MKPKDAAPAPRAHSRRMRRAAWAAALFFAIGYFPTVLLGSPVLSMAVAACVAIPYGNRCDRPGRGAVRGGLLGAVAGLAMAGGLFKPIVLYNASLSTSQPATQVAPATQRNASTAPATAPAYGRTQGEPIPFPRVAATTLVGSAGLCAAAGAMAAYLGRRRRRMIEDQWNR